MAGAGASTVRRRMASCSGSPRRRKSGNHAKESGNSLGGAVNLVAQGDKALIDLSGFESYSTERVRHEGGVTFIPSNVRWEEGTVSGTAVLRWKGDGKGSMYEVQTCTGDPNTEAPGATGAASASAGRTWTA